MIYWEFLLASILSLLCCLLSSGIKKAVTFIGGYRKQAISYFRSNAIYVFLYLRQFSKKSLWLEFCDDINYWLSVTTEVTLIGFKTFQERENSYLK